VRLLLDTHAFLWWIDDNSALGSSARAAINVPTNPVYVSAASAWEIAIKRSKGTLEAPRGDVATWIAEEGFAELDITLRHGAAAGALPLHHRDPFDRVLVAQAQLEEMTLVTADPALAAYDVALIPAGR
jgi:PIN domain nuclease of toxin-antitoxin system